MSIPVYKPSIKRKEMDSVLTCLVSDQIGAGAVSAQLGDLLIQMTRGRYCHLLREYERSIEAAFRFLDIHSGDRFILTPLAPGAYLHVMRRLGIEPVFVDVQDHTGVPELDDILDCIDEKTRGLLLYGVMGYQWDFSEWEHPGIHVIEDITQNAGSLTGDIASGMIGDIVLMRMEPQDLITSGGGCALIVRHKSLKSRMEEVMKGYDPTIYLPDMNAALALAQMKEFEQNLELREELYKLFLTSLMKGRHGYFMTQSEGRVSHRAMPVLIKGNRKEIQGYALKKNVETTLAFRGCCLEEGEEYDLNCPRAESLVLNCILFPLYPSLGKKNCETITRILATLP